MAKQKRMDTIDHTLVHEVRRFITGANVHTLKTWMFCYETSAPGSHRRMRFEMLLRQFLREKRILRDVQTNAELVRALGEDKRRISLELDRRIDWPIGA